MTPHKAPRASNPCQAWVTIFLLLSAANPVSASVAQQNGTTAPAQAASNPAASVEPAVPSADAPPFGLGRLDREDHGKFPAEATVYLDFIRLTPHALDDEVVLRNFILLNNLGNGEAGRHLANEFDRPQVFAYYKSHATEILAWVPTTTPVISVQTAIRLGDYDMTRKAFPADSPTINAAEVEVSSLRLPGITSLADRSPIAPPNYFRNPLQFLAEFNTLRIDWVPVSEEVARRYVESIGPRGDRTLDVVIKVEIQHQRPEIGFATRIHKYLTVGIPAKVVSVQVFDRIRDASGGTGHLLATLAPETISSAGQ